MELTFVISVITDKQGEHIRKTTVTCKDFNDGFLKAYAEIISLYNEDKHPITKFTLERVKFYLK